MSETEDFVPITEEEAQARIQSAFLTLDAIYNLHGPADQDAEVWQCGHCDVQWPCETEKLILDGLGLTSVGISESEEPSA
jgi:hypothetical protein